MTAGLLINGFVLRMDHLRVFDLACACKVSPQKDHQNQERNVADHWSIPSRAKARSLPAIWLSCNRQTYRLNGPDEKFPALARSCALPWSYSERTARPHTPLARARRLGPLSGAVLT